LVAQIRRKSTLVMRPPTGSISPSCSARSSLTWMCSGISPISSRNRVPVLASTKRPSRVRVAPVKAPFSWPNSSLSRIDSGQGGAVGGHQLARGAAAVLVDVAGEQLLAGAALAEQQHGRRGAGRLLGHLERGAHDLAVADDRLVGCGGELGPQLAVFGDEGVLVERLLDGGDDRRALERLGDEVVGAELHRGDRVLDGAVGGHHQDLDLGRDRLRGLEQVLAGHAGHAQVGDHHLHRVQAQHLERLLPGAGDAHVHVLLGQHLLQGVEDAGLVVDDEHGGEDSAGRHGHGGS
jgi:hypothetical protein